MGKNKKIDDTMLLWAISEALDIANTEIIVRNIPVTVFCDSQRALSEIALPLHAKSTGFREALYTKRLQSSKITETS